MAELVVEATGLRKAYGGALSGRRKVVAVDGIDLRVERGTVHGFLGPNGAGKTTTLRMLLGLTRRDRGEVRLLGADVPGDLTTALRKVGAVVEEPSFSPDLSARKNLHLLAGLGGIPRARVDVVLERVGLGKPGRERVGNYSLGMRQRLGVAAALLKDPELLILDEPSNGLDPAGIIEMRDLIRGLGADGVTVLLSSHILAEVQQVCSAVTIIGEGKVLADGRVADLLGESSTRTRVEVADPDNAIVVLTRAGYAVAREGGALLVEGHEHPEEVTRVLADAGQYVRELSAVRPDLEAYYLRLTGHLPDAPEDPFDRVVDEAAERIVVPPAATETPEPEAPATEDGGPR